MRPGKSVLVYGPDEDHLGVMCLVLKCWGFRVTRFHSGVAATRELNRKEYDAALILEDNDPLVVRWKQVSDTSVVAFMVRATMPPTSHADRVVLEPNGKKTEFIETGVAAMIQAVKVAAARKRGPKKCRSYPAEVIQGGAVIVARRRKVQAA